MKRQNQFDEVMIVNPSENGTNSDQRVRLMRFHNIYPPELGRFAEPNYYGYYAGPQTYGYYGQPGPYGYPGEDPYLSQDRISGEFGGPYGYYGETDPMVGYYGQVDPTLYGPPEPNYGYYGQSEPAPGYYQANPGYGYYAQAPANAETWDGYGYGYGNYGPVPQPVGYFAEEFPFGYYGEDLMPAGPYGQPPELVGYGEPERQFADDYPPLGYYGETEFAQPEFGNYDGYTREMSPSFNPGCPLPTNVNGLDGVDGFSGYARPATVNPSCDQITPQSGSDPSAPDTFKPLW